MSFDAVDVNEYACLQMLRSTVNAEYLITWGGDWVVGITATGFTALPAGQIPVVGGTVVTCQTYDIWLTLALPCDSLAHTFLTIHTLAAISTQKVTCAFWMENMQKNMLWSSTAFFFAERFSMIMSLTSAVASGSVPKIASLADATCGALCVIKTLPALPSLSITGISVWHVYIVVTLAQLTVPSRLRWVAIVTWGTFLATTTWIK